MGLAPKSKLLRSADAFNVRHSSSMSAESPETNEEAAFSAPPSVYAKVLIKLLLVAVVCLGTPILVLHGLLHLVGLDPHLWESGLLGLGTFLTISFFAARAKMRSGELGLPFNP